MSLTSHIYLLYTNIALHLFSLKNIIFTQMSHELGPGWLNELGS